MHIDDELAPGPCMTGYDIERELLCRRVRSARRWRRRRAALRLRRLLAGRGRAMIRRPSGRVSRD